MKNGSSPFVWYELMTTDADNAQDFYTKVVGWTAKDAGVPGMKYTLFEVPGCMIAGMMSMADMSKEDCGGEPGWIGYVGVANADEYAKKVEAEGGKVLRAAQDIPDIGRFAIVSDPQGGIFALLNRKTTCRHRLTSVRANRGIRVGMNCMLKTARRYFRSMRKFSAGSSHAISTWGLWAITRCSVSMAPITAVS